MPSGEPILLLSSLLADWRSWNDVAGRLPSGVYAITMDLRGHGTSSPSAGDYSLAELAADVLNVMDNLAFARVHLVGTSVGSMVAQYLGATAGHRLISLTLVAAGSLVPEPAWPIWDKRVAAVRSGGLITQVPIVYPAWFSGAVDQGLLDLAESMILATTVAGFTGAVAAIKGHDARSLLPQVETPTLVIAGANDAAVPPEAVRATAALIPGAAFEVVTGAAHQVAMQHPVAFADRLCRHIAGAPR
ncbi:alpha/beta hydrolase [Sphingobium indicum IP26]|uniref:alpha/beta fold hydrolase n=1 Tax=Sphingomonadales TaxID=204457 RepID=UPI0003634234|nr:MULTISPECIES: alpha/beta fold hydrolase [Sphingomonadaceae]EPR19094.1 alpha/beta hydrolase [Sphingobium indicum IP26]